MQLISKKTVLKTHLFEVVASIFKFSGNKEKTYYTAERNPSVFIFPLNENNEIYLIEQYRYMLKRKMLEAPAGFVDKGEDPLEAAKRELREETGLIASKWLHLGKIELAASVFKSEADIFLAFDLEEGKQELDDTEEIKVVKLKLSEALKRVESFEINESGTMLGILLMDKLKKENKI